MHNQGTSLSPIASKLYHLLWVIIDLIIPSHCASCGELGYRLCPKCTALIKPISPPICEHCGEPLSNFATRSQHHCEDMLTAVKFIRSYCVYKPPLSIAIHKFKYQRDIGMAEILSQYLLKLYNSIDYDADIIIPVPLNQDRLRDRGYNQAKLLAKPISFGIEKPMISKALVRKRNTRPQVGLTREERLLNVIDAFHAESHYVKGKNVLLIDDVTTTGSTLQACAQELKKVGANAIVGLTLARAVKTNDGFSDVLVNPKNSLP